MNTAAGKRIRRATLTEIKEGEEWEWPNPGNLDEESSDSECEENESDELSTEEIFNNFDELIQDWKSNLEIVVSDALKKLKKNSRDKKLAVKFIPGEGTNKRDDIINPVKEEIYTHWKREMKQVIKVTQKRLNKLNHDKLGEINNLGFKGKYLSAPVAPVTKGTKVLEKGIDLKALFKDMENLYSAYGEKMSNKIPIYNIGGIEKSRSCAAFPWWKPVCTMCNMAIEYPIKKAIKYQENDREVLDILKDFTMDYRTTKKLQDGWNEMHKMKEAKPTETERKLKKNLLKGRRGSSSTQRMMERRERKKYVMKEIEINGEKRYYLIKKKEEKAAEDAADIFADWKNNLMKKKQRKPRQRKLSHRAQRKEMLKQEIAMPYAPKTYAEALKTNLKRTEQQSVEDIFQSFTYYLKHLAKKDYTPNDWADIFFNFRHNFHVPASRPEDIDILATTTCIPGLNSGSLPGVMTMNGNLDCGRPTISALPNLPRGKILLPPMKLTGRKIMKPSRTFTKEILLKKERALNMKPMKKQQQVAPKRDYTQEEIFSDWMVNLADMEPASTSIQLPNVIKFGYIQEQFFQDWIHNLEEPKVQRAQKIRESQNMQRAQENKSPKIHRGPLAMKQLDYTCEQYFAEWSSNLMESEGVEIIRRPAAASQSPPKTPSPTPRLTRKATPPKKKETTAVMMNDEVFEDYKEDRRHDFNKVNKIKDKKKIQAEKKGSGKRVK